jgi:hypothetical protein
MYCRRNKTIMSQNEQDYRSEFDQWQDARDAARAATGGILIESTSDSSEANLEANMFQPMARREVVVTTAQPVRPDARTGATEFEHFVVEDHSSLIDGAELRANGARFAKNLGTFKEAHPNFELETANAGELPLEESTRRAILGVVNGPAVMHFLCQSPELAVELARLPPLAAAAAVRRMSADLQQMGTLDSQTSYQEWRSERNKRDARRRSGRNG